MGEPFTEIKSGKLLKIFSKDECRQIDKHWMKVFCQNKQGFNTSSFKWHIFSGGDYPALESEAAQKAYEQHDAQKYIVMSNKGKEAFLTDKRPENLNCLDCHVFPENLAWTMAFTHEEGWLGPYFAKNKNYKILEDENENQLEKLRQIEFAKNKGWA